MGGRDLLDYTWPTLHGYDILFAQRPSLPNHARVIQMARDERVPVWVDYDDLLTNVPPDNPTHEAFMNTEMQSGIDQSLALATVVSTSTQFLADELRKRVNTPPYVVIPNALPDRILPRPPLARQSGAKRIILWRGSNTHQADIAEHAESILQAYNAHDDWFWFFLGAKPWMLLEKMKPGTYGTAPWATISKYFDLLQRLQPDIVYVPLKDCPFNRAKSNLAALEGAWAHAAVIAPDWEEWKIPGVMNYQSTPYRPIMKAMSENSESLHGYNDLTWSAIMETRTLKTVNQKRMELLESLVSVSA